MLFCRFEEAERFIMGEASHSSFVCHAQLHESGHIPAEQLLVDGVLQRCSQYSQDVPDRASRQNGVTAFRT
jgi:hypothetical protein